MTERVFLAFFRPESREKTISYHLSRSAPGRGPMAKAGDVDPLTTEAGHDSFRIRDKELRR